MIKILTKLLLCFFLSACLHEKEDMPNYHVTLELKDQHGQVVNTFQQEETIRIQMNWKNSSNETVELYFITVKFDDIFIYNKQGELVDTNADVPVALGSVSHDLLPGETLETWWDWDQMDRNTKTLIPVGNYTVSGNMLIQTVNQKSIQNNTFSQPLMIQ